MSASDKRRFSQNTAQVCLRLPPPAASVILADISAHIAHFTVPHQQEENHFSCLIAPRPLTILTGREDTIFPLYGVEQSYAVTKKIYAAAGAADKCRLVIMPKGHHFCPDEAWTAILEETRKLGW